MKVITHAAYRRLQRLDDVSQRLWRKLEAVAKEAAEITGDQHPFGVSWDCFFVQATTLAAVLKGLGIEVEPKKKAGRPRKTETNQ